MLCATEVSKSFCPPAELVLPVGSEYAKPQSGRGVPVADLFRLLHPVAGLVIGTVGKKPTLLPPVPAARPVSDDRPLDADGEQKQ